MKYKNHSIVFVAGRYIARLMAKQLSPDLLFHNFHHTLNVVRGVRTIGRNLQLPSDQLEILLLAAWFHDSGHIKTYKGHEIESQHLAKVFLERHHYPAEKTAEVLACIGATQMPQQPQNLLQQVICDADLFHLSLSEYPHLQHQLREEWSRVFNKTYSDDQWTEENLSFLEHHQYFTTFGQEVLQKRKLKNIEKCIHLKEESIHI